MKEKVNIAKLLLDTYPNIKEAGVQIYSKLHGAYVEVTNIGGADNSFLGEEMIEVKELGNRDKNPRDLFYSNGAYYKNGDCLLQPTKEQPDWNKVLLQPFNREDIIFCDGVIGILKELSLDKFKTYISLFCGKLINKENETMADTKRMRLATQEEIDRLLKTLDYFGLRWNKTTKKTDTVRFKVGQEVYEISEPRATYKISNITDDGYYLTGTTKYIPFENQESWELVPVQKIKVQVREEELSKKPEEKKEMEVKLCIFPNFKHFDPVLTRCNEHTPWTANFFSHYNTAHPDTKYPYVVIGGVAHMYCIPYNEETKHLTGTTDSIPSNFCFIKQDIPL